MNIYIFFLFANFHLHQMDPQDASEIRLEFVVSPEYNPPQLKPYYDIFPSMRMEKYLQPEVFSVFQLNPEAINILFGSPATYFMFLTIKFDFHVLFLIFKNNF